MVKFNVYNTTFHCATLKIFVFALLTYSDFSFGQQIITPPFDATGIAGETAEFQCSVEFGPIPTVAWEFNDSIIYSMETQGENYPAGNDKYLVTHDGGNFTLWVKDLDFKDGGMYTCSAMIPSASAALIVLGTPQLNISTPNIVEGKSVEYTCVAQFSGPSNKNISSVQHPQLQIFFAGVPLKGKVVEENCTESANCFKFKQVSTKLLEANDNGNEVMCKFGTSSPQVYLNTSTEVTVLYSVRSIAYTPKRETYEVGAYINCTADGNPEPKFTWDDIFTGNIVDGQTLEVTEQMLGNNSWKCKARNSIGGIQHQESLTAVFEATFSDDTGLDSGSDSWKAGVGVTVTVCVVVILVTILYCKKRKGQNKTPSSRKSKSMSKNVTEESPDQQRKTLIKSKPWKEQMKPETLFHGNLAGDKVKKLLKEDGAYLITHVNNDKSTIYHLWIMSNNELDDVLIEYKNGVWILNTKNHEVFPTIGELIESLAGRRLAIAEMEVILCHPINRKE